MYFGFQHENLNSTNYNRNLLTLTVRMSEYDDGMNSLPDFPANSLNNDFDTELFQLQEEERERITIERQFTDMKHQICEITSLAKLKTEKIASSNREGNDENTLATVTNTNSRSDESFVIFLITRL